LRFLQGSRVAAINVAEGQKQSQILASEGRKTEQINTATGMSAFSKCLPSTKMTSFFKVFTFFFLPGEANAILAKANARAEAILKVAESLSLKVAMELMLLSDFPAKHF
jgi:regulator of protease activity HflC (stomatin/prohibitin superfamily)